MLKRLNLLMGLAIGMCYFALAGSAYAQQWYKDAQSAPVVQPPQEAKETKNWNFVIGGGVGYAPTYEGSDKYHVLPIPVVNVDYNNGLFFANIRNGIGSYLLRGENYKIGASLGFAPGRDEDEDTENLRGMGDVDASATVNFLAEYDFGIMQLAGKLTTSVSGDYGTTAELSAGTRYSLTRKVALTGSVGTMWADKEHMSNRFGVTAAQSARSGYSQYDAESGIKSVGFSAGVSYLVTDKWTANLTFRGDKLLRNAADSPVVKDDFVPAAFLTTSYKF